MRLLSEVLGALGAGALVFVIARQLGAGRRHAVVAMALVPVAVAALLALPNLNAGRSELQNLRHENEVYAPGEAQVLPGHDAGISVEFFGWVGERLGDEDTFHLEVGRIPDETYVGGVGVRQAAILQWGLYQLAPSLAVEQSPKARDLEPGEGRNADWIVFYGASPAGYPAPLRDVITYAPKYAMARSGP